MIRTESHCFKKGTHNYDVFLQMSRDAKLIYNAAQYRVRKSFLEKGKFLNYNAIDRYFKEAYHKRESVLYRRLGTAISQQIYRVIEKEWLSFFAAVKSYRLNSAKFLGRPRPPHFAKSDVKTFVIGNQTFKVVDNEIRFKKPTKFSAYWVALRPDSIKIHSKFDKIKQLRIIPRGSHIKVEIVYEIEDVPLLETNGNILSIDPGMNNLLTCVSNVPNFVPRIYSGKPLKSINQFYNKRRAILSSIAKKSNNHYSTKQLEALTTKRNRKINQYVHEVTKSVIATALSHGITKIVLGSGGTNSKRNSNLSKKTNQNFVSLPFSLIIQQLSYKAQNVGIELVVTEESYTSGTSFLDNELPTKRFYNKARRVSRGLFLSNNGTRINADVNGAYQILRKVTPEFLVNDGVEGLVFNPVKERIRYC